MSNLNFESLLSESDIMGKKFINAAIQFSTPILLCEDTVIDDFNHLQDD